LSPAWHFDRISAAEYHHETNRYIAARVWPIIEAWSVSPEQLPSPCHRTRVSAQAGVWLTTVYRQNHRSTADEDGKPRPRPARFTAHLVQQRDCRRKAVPAEGRISCLPAQRKPSPVMSTIDYAGTDLITRPTSSYLARTLLC